MTAISASDVKSLRERTGAGMMECKKALLESSGNIDDAIDWLRKQGLSKAAKKATRAAKEGLIFDYTSADNSVVALVEVHCETDFVAKTAEFQAFGEELALLVGKTDLGTVEAVLDAKLKDETVREKQTAITAKLGENIGLSNVARVHTVDSSDKLAKYVHAGNKIGVLVRFADPANQLTEDAARDVAMHVAAMNPPYIRRDQVPAEELEREKAIHRDQLSKENKPADMIEKIIGGKLNRFYSDICLEEQIFVKDPQGKLSVIKALQAVGDKIAIIEVERLQVGSGGNA